MTYFQVGLVAVGVAALVHAGAVVVARRRGTLPPRFGRATGLTVLVLVALTVVFDSIMIAADLFRFDESALLGVRLGLAPLEDLAWPVAAGLALPALLAAIGPRRD